MVRAFDANRFAVRTEGDMAIHVQRKLGDNIAIGHVNAGDNQLRAIPKRYPILAYRAWRDRGEEQTLAVWGEGERPALGAKSRKRGGFFARLQIPNLHRRVIDVLARLHGKKLAIVR